ncbi:MAG: sensor histidine kinase [Pseudomonadota bacterium]
MNKGLKRFYFIKSAILTILFSAAVYFENAQQARFFTLVALFLLYLAAGFSRQIFGASGKWYYYSFFLDTALVFALEFNSRLLINYFFHSFYIFILLEAALALPLRRGITAGAISVLVSLIKYAYLIYYKFDLSSVSQMAFFLMVNGLILVIAGFAQKNREEKERTDMLNKELLDAYRKLKEYNDEVNRLTVIEERNRIARDLHDTLGHNMTALIMQLQMAEHLAREDLPKAEGLLSAATKTARESLSGIRAIVETLRGREAASTAARSTKDLVQEFASKTGADIKLDIEGTDANCSKAAASAVYHIVQESLTNAVRHGNAGRISVQLTYTAEAVSFSVRDNGRGSETVKEGYGLRGIRERAEAFGGWVAYGNDDGFYIKGILYLEEKDDKSTVGR